MYDEDQPVCCTLSKFGFGSLTSCSTASFTAVSWAQTQDLLLGALAASGEERSACQVQHSAERSAALSKRESCQQTRPNPHPAGPCCRPQEQCCVGAGSMPGVLQSRPCAR